MPPVIIPAAVTLDFSPVLEMGAFQLPLRALLLAIGIGAALAWFARRIRHADPDASAGDRAFVVLAAIPGAVVGGRIAHGLASAGAYALEPQALLDLGRGSLSLAGAVVGGALTAAYVCQQLGGRPSAWADAAVAPLLLAIGLGKVAMLLAGAGQGIPWDGRGGIAFGGAGPWADLDAGIAAYPTQLLEGAWALLGIPVLLVLERRWRRSTPWPQAGTVALAGVAWWLAGRTAVAVWWRDETVLGPWGREGLLSFVLLVLSVALIARRTRGGPTSDQGPYPSTPVAS